MIERHGEIKLFENTPKEKKSLIICPVGTEITFDNRYDSFNHWRYTNRLPRNYETLIISYNDFEPELNTYDYRLKLKNHKWELFKALPAILGMNFFQKYDYIACVDDDLITDIQSFNTGIKLAREFDFRLWQLSMVAGSGIIYRCLMQNKDWIFSETDFIEMGSPFFRQDIFWKVQKFLYEIGTFEVGWGIDKMFCQFLEETANVVHCASIYHPPNHIKPSYYDQSKAMEEMVHMIDNVYPKVMKNVYKKDDWRFKDSQNTLRVWKNNNE